MLCWVINRLSGSVWKDTILRENCELDSWWNGHQTAYRSELARKQEEKERKEKIECALKKLTAEERTLLKV